MTGYLGGRFGMSQRDMVEMFETVFHLDMGLGSISAQEQCISQALAQPMNAALEYVQEQTAKNMDETVGRLLLEQVKLFFDLWRSPKDRNVLTH